jgi:hypothetical protein
MATLPMVASPFDTAAHSRSLVQISSPLAKRWRPSQFNARAIASDSNMLLWNTRSGAFSVIPAVRRLQTEQMLKKNGFAGELDTLGQYLLNAVIWFLQKKANWTLYYFRCTSNTSEKTD